MMTFLKIFAVFWIIWILWYITGGPLRDDTSKKYVGINQQGVLETSATTTEFKK
jgi:hypothetical protein